MTTQMIKDEFKNYLQKYMSFNSSMKNIDNSIITNTIKYEKEKIYEIHFSFIPSYKLYFDNHFKRIPTSMIPFFEAEMFKGNI